jgi:hypothetical protein
MVLVGGPEGKRPLGRSRLRWKDNIKMELQDAGRVARVEDRRDHTGF